MYAVKSDKRNMFSSLLECANTGFDLICNLVFLALGILFVQKGYTTLGAIAAIYTMYGRFSRQFLQMGKYIPELIAYLTYAQNIFDFLDEETEDKSKKLNKSDILNHKDINEDVVINEINNFCGHNTILNNADYSVKISDLTFSYIKDENNAPIVVLDNYNERIKSGEFVAVTGASGSGKTTLSKLLMGFYKPDSGMIEVCGNNLDDISLAAGRSFFALVPQDAILFNMSIMDNIRMGRLDATEAEIIKAAKMANAHQFIIEFTDGYDTVVGEKGMSVSGGQRQRVALGRAIVRNAKVFLMDEPLSNLDAKLRVQMRSEIIQLHERIGATTIYVTHDQTEAMTMADRIVVMKGGYIQQIGTPKEIYNNPANLFVAGFLGAPATNFVKGTYTNGFFHVGDMKIEIPLMYREKLSSYQGKEIIMGIRPEDLHGEGIVADTYPSANFDFEIEVAELLGHEYILHGALNGQKMCAKVNSRLEPEAHSTIKLTMDLSKIHFFDIETENRID